MSKRERIPHTARFLQTFHTAGAAYAPQVPDQASEERAALNFLTGGSGRTAEPQFIYIRGYKIRQGLDLLSEKQAKWIVDIAETKANVTDEMVKSLSIRLEQGFARSAASEFINRYKDWPVKEQTAWKGAPVGTIVPDGRYAIQMEGQDKPHFYLVKSGRRTGMIFVNQQVSDDVFPIMRSPAKAAILAEISKDVDGAGKAYAALLGRCRRCGRTLTDHNNPYFLMGFGPDCGSKR